MESVKHEFYQPKIGMDVEFFIKNKDGEVVESSSLIRGTNIEINSGKITKDGVQGEINPSADRCRLVLGRNVSKCIMTLQEHLKNRSFDIDTTSSIEIPVKNFEKMSDDSKKFGCSPDFNAYKECEQNVRVSGDSTRQRTAGGHIHIGLDTINVQGVDYDEECLQCEETCKFNRSGSIELKDEILRFKDFAITKIIRENYSDMDDDSQKIIKKLAKIKNDNHIIFNLGKATKTCIHPEIAIPLIDLIAGIPSVLIDRSGNNKKRRKIYGKAGDFRYQPHGIEYRTLSNFWIKSYTMMHLMTGLVRTGFLLASSDINNGTAFTKMFFSKVSKKDVAKAINEDNYVMARDIFLAIEDLLVAVGNVASNNHPINSSTIHGFKDFVLKGEDVLGTNIWANWAEDSDKWVPWESYANSFNGVKSAVTKSFRESV